MQGFLALNNCQGAYLNMTPCFALQNTLDQASANVEGAGNLTHGKITRGIGIENLDDVLIGEKCSGVSLSSTISAVAYVVLLVSFSCVPPQVFEPVICEYPVVVAGFFSGRAGTDEGNKDKGVNAFDEASSFDSHIQVVSPERRFFNGFSDCVTVAVTSDDYPSKSFHSPHVRDRVHSFTPRDFFPDFFGHVGLLLADFVIVIYSDEDIQDHEDGRPKRVIEREKEE